jgi:hypothetical protein
VLLGLGSLAALALLFLVAHHFSREARLGRRRRRNNYRIANKGREPMVKFSVRTRKE